MYIARKMFAELVYDTAALEDSPYTFPEVQTLLDGITVGGHRLEDQQLVLNQAQSWKRLLSLVEHGSIEYFNVGVVNIIFVCYSPNNPTIK